jgi:hypothetical protein
VVDVAASVVVDAEDFAAVDVEAFTVVVNFIVSRLLITMASAVEKSLPLTTTGCQGHLFITGKACGTNSHTYNMEERVSQ